MTELPAKADLSGGQAWMRRRHLTRRCAECAEKFRVTVPWSAAKFCGPCRPKKKNSTKQEILDVE